MSIIRRVKYGNRLFYGFISKVGYKNQGSACQGF